MWERTLGLDKLHRAKDGGMPNNMHTLSRVTTWHRDLMYMLDKQGDRCGTAVNLTLRPALSSTLTLSVTVSVTGRFLQRFVKFTCCSGVVAYDSNSTILCVAQHCS